MAKQHIESVEGIEGAKEELLAAFRRRKRKDRDSELSLEEQAEMDAEIARMTEEIRANRAEMMRRGGTAGDYQGLSRREELVVKDPL